MFWAPVHVQNASYRCSFDINIHICDTFTAGCAPHMCICIYMCIHAYVYGCICASMKLFDALRRRCWDFLSVYKYACICMCICVWCPYVSLCSSYIRLVTGTSFQKFSTSFFEHFRWPNLMFSTTPVSLWFFTFFTPFVWNRPNSRFLLSNLWWAVGLGDPPQCVFDPLWSDLTRLPPYVARSKLCWPNLSRHQVVFSIWPLYFLHMPAQCHLPYMAPTGMVHCCHLHHDVGQITLGPTLM